MTPMISILTLYKADNTIFNNLVVPTDTASPRTFEDINKDKVIERILMDAAELNLVYTSPKFMKAAIGTWSYIENIKWTRMQKAICTEYNPLDSYAYHTESTTTPDLTDTTQRTSKVQTTGGSSEIGYDSGTMLETNQNSATTQTIGNPTDNQSQTKRTGTSLTERDVTGRSTSAQPLIKEELDIALESVYDTIVKSFINKFCVEVY